MRLTWMALVVSVMALAVSVLIGCEAGVIETPADDGQQTAAYSFSPASECNQEDRFKAPSFNLLDLGAILAQVTYYALGPAQFGELFTGSWTNWYQANMNTALAKLATMRSVLDKYNLHDTYLPGTRPKVDCGQTDTTVRQLDGTCNDLTNTAAGAMNVRVGRNIPLFLPNPASPTGYAPNPAAYPAPTDAQLLTPSPREVSRQLFTRGAGGMKPVPFLNLMAAAWIQFNVHDWFDHDNTTSSELFHIPLASDDPLRNLNITELLVTKTQRDVSALGQPLPPVYKNLETHWWDASQVYGKTKAASDALRAVGAGGTVMAELAMDAKGLLVNAADGFENTGMRKNWWIGLGVMHNVFAREHNAVVAMLKQSHPEKAGNEDWYFHHARMIVAAEIAKIHTVEWTPAILPNRTATVGLNANWYGLKKFLDPISAAGLPAFMAAAGAAIQADPTLTPAEKAERIGAAKAAVMGVLGGDTNNHGIPYSLTEEFVSVYRMHPLLPDNVTIWDHRSETRAAIYKTEQTRMAGARSIEDKHGMANVVYSFGVEHPGALVLANYPGFIQQLVMPFGILDMGAVDVLRDRERGIPRYNDFRVQLRLKRVNSIEDLTPDAGLRAALHRVYGDDAGAIDRVDALVGTFGEATRPSCYGFGETLFQVFTEMATRRLQADRFYTSDYNATTYTAEGIKWIAVASMKSILLRHYPELRHTNLSDTQNAFFPWN